VDRNSSPVEMRYSSSPWRNPSPMTEKSWRMRQQEIIRGPTRCYDPHDRPPAKGRLSPNLNSPWRRAIQSLIGLWFGFYHSHGIDQWSGAKRQLAWLLLHRMRDESVGFFPCCIRRIRAHPLAEII